MIGGVEVIQKMASPHRADSVPISKSSNEYRQTMDKIKGEMEKLNS
jgi:hypothetical protein